MVLNSYPRKPGRWSTENQLPPRCTKKGRALCWVTRSPLSGSDELGADPVFRGSSSNDHWPL